MAYVITYIVLVLAFYYRPYKKKKESGKKYYTHPEGTWTRALGIPFIVVFLMYLAFPHGTLIRGGVETKVMKKIETDALIIEAKRDVSTTKNDRLVFWWLEPLFTHNRIYYVVTSKTDSSVVKIDNGFSSENYEFNKITNGKEQD